MRIVCFGLPLAPLLLMEDGHEVMLAVLSPGSSLGGRRLRRRLVSGALCTADATDPACVEKALAAADLLVSWFWTRQLPESWLALPRCGAVGVHPSLLPRHRGPNPFFWAIDSGDRLTGVSAHWLTREYDRGDVLLQETLEVGGRDSWQLARALDRPSLRVLRTAVRQIERGGANPLAQDEARATWAPEPQGEQLRVNWRWPTLRVLRRIRALAPVPGLALEVEGLRFFATRARRAEEFPEALAPGEAAVACGETLVVRTSDGAVAIEKAQLTPESPESTEKDVDEAELAGLVRDRVVLDSPDGGP